MDASTKGWDRDGARPIHVSIEGIPGAGKSKLLAQLKEEAIKQGILDMTTFKGEDAKILSNFGTRRTNLLAEVDRDPASVAAQIQHLMVGLKTATILESEPVLITVGSLPTLSNVYIPYYQGKGGITCLEKEMVEHNIQLAKLHPRSTPDVYLYLRQHREVAWSTSIKEGKEEEVQWDLGHYQDLHILLERWLVCGKSSVVGPEVWVEEDDQKGAIDVSVILSRILERAGLAPLDL